MKTFEEWLKDNFSDVIDLWQKEQNQQVKPEGDEKWIVYLARPNNDNCYLTACTEDFWDASQKDRHAKTKLFIGTESDTQQWYETRQKFAEIIKAWEDGKIIEQYDKENHCWMSKGEPNWGLNSIYRIKPKDDKTFTWSNIEDCKHCVYEPKATTQEPCDKCFGKSMFKPKEKEEETKDKVNPIQEKKMRRYNLNLGDWDELKEMAVKMFKGIAALNERFARKISGDEFVTQDDWKEMNGLWQTFNYTNDDKKFCKEDLHHLFTDDLDEEFVEIEAEEAKDKKKLRPYINSVEMIADFIARFKTDCPPYEEPSIWVKNKVTDARHLVTSFVPCSDDDGSYVVLFDYTCDLNELFNEYTYLDGSPCGMEVKE